MSGLARTSTIRRLGRASWHVVPVPVLRELRTAPGTPPAGWARSTDWLDPVAMAFHKGDGRGFTFRVTYLEHVVGSEL